MRSRYHIRLMLLFICFAVGLAACDSRRAGGAGSAHANTGGQAMGEPFDFGEYFSYEPMEMPAAAGHYSLPLGREDIAEFEAVASRLSLEDDEREFLLDHGFAVTGFHLVRQCENVVTAYEAIGRSGVPILVTSGSLLHTYHVLFGDLLSTIEARHLYDDMWRVSKGLLDECLALHQESEGELKEAARRDAAFLAVGLRLMSPDAAQIEAPARGPGRGGEPNPKEYQGGDLAKYAFEVPELLREVVSAEMDLIMEHSGANASPLFIYKEDYSQYVPRGHYTATEKLKNYFRAMMWFGRMTMLLKGTDQVDPGEACSQCDAFISRYDARVQTLGAMILSDAMGRDAGLMEAWERAYRVTSFFVGFSDDLGPYEYLDAMNQVFGGRLPLDSYSRAEHGKLKANLAEFRSPKIYGGTGGCALAPPFTPEQADECLAKTRGFRLMGQRFVPDSYILSKLVAPHTGEFLGGELPFTAFNIPGVGVQRVFPRGLDVMAVVGSSRALEVLANLGDTNYAAYDKAFADIKSEIDSIETEEWNKNLYWNWLWSLKGLLASAGEGYPAFMQSDAWGDRLLKIALASWAQLRHDTILYVKQSYTMELTAMPPPSAAMGYVEPVPELYNRLLSLTRMTRLGLEAMELLDDAQERRLKNLESVLERLITISLTELRGEQLSEQDSRYIGRFDDVLDGVVSGVDEKSQKTTIVADVHTDSNSGQVLEEGVGYVDLLVVAWKQGDEIYLAAGPELSYYEFKHPMDDRLTDEAWRDMLASDPPPGPAWLP